MDELVEMETIWNEFEEEYTELAEAMVESELIIGWGDTLTIEIPSPEWDWNTDPLKAAGTAATALLFDDASGLGFLNDPLIPAVIAIGTISTFVASIAANWEYSFDGLDVSIFFFGEHTKNDNPANLSKHQKGQRNKIKGQRGGEKGDSRRSYIPPRHK